MVNQIVDALQERLTRRGTPSFLAEEAAEFACFELDCSRLSEGSGIHNPMAWSWVVAQRKAIDLQWRGQHCKPLDRATDAVAQDGDPVATAASRELCDDMRAAVMKLPCSAQRDEIILHFWGPHHEMAAQCSGSTSTTGRQKRYRVERAKEWLRLHCRSKLSEHVDFVFGPVLFMLARIRRTWSSLGQTRVSTHVVLSLSLVGVATLIGFVATSIGSARASGHADRNGAITLPTSEHLLGSMLLLEDGRSAFRSDEAIGVLNSFEVNNDRGHPASLSPARSLSETKESPSIAWQVTDGARRRGAAWIEARRELVVVNYSTRQIEIWNEYGILRAYSLPLAHLSDVVVRGGSVWAVCPGGVCFEIDVSVVDAIRCIDAGDPGSHWLTNGICADDCDRIHISRGGDGLVVVYDRLSGREVGHWQLPQGHSYLDSKGTLLAVAHDSPNGTSELLAFALVDPATMPADGSTIHSFRRHLSDVQVMRDGSIVALVESAGLFRFAPSAQADTAWTLKAFLPLEGLLGPHVRVDVERFALEEGLGLLAIAAEQGNRPGLFVVQDPAWIQEPDQLSKILNEWGTSPVTPNDR